MPSSKYLARDAVRIVVDQLRKPDRRPLSILEIGPGTGTFTERILPDLRLGDRFDVVELNSYFYHLLKDRFRSNGAFRLHHQDFVSFNPGRKYDFLLSSLPYETIPAPVTRRLWKQKLRLCRPGSYIIYYKYVNFNLFRSRYEQGLVKNCLLDEKVVLLNFPPARLLTLRVDDPEKRLRTVPARTNQPLRQLRVNGQRALYTLKKQL